MTLKLNGVEIDDLRVNGVKADKGYLNGTEVYQTIEAGAIVGGDIVVGIQDGYYILAAASNNRVIRKWQFDYDDSETVGGVDAVEDFSFAEHHAGKTNTDRLCNYGTYRAALYCRSLGPDYYLPGVLTLNFLAQNYALIDDSDPNIQGNSTEPSLSNIKNTTARDGVKKSLYMVSSTQYAPSSGISRHVWVASARTGTNPVIKQKDKEYWVIPVRKIPT